ncbi:hypothetical protein KAS14_05695 [Candidatus Bathyarchaeota archaeon]|nr:hypothetical protein [Candidatus Bathyarchaeota archaeon]
MNALIEMLDIIRFLTPIIVPAIIAIFAIYRAFRFRQELSFPEQIANIPEFLRREYAYRKFDENKFKTLEQARNEIRNITKIKRMNVKEIQKEILENEDSWYNKFAYQASIGLQHIGLMILVGAIPIKLVLPDIGKLIIEDWSYCSELIEKKLREDVLTLKTDKKYSKKIHFSRRHAEWLAYAAALYLYNYWEGEKTNELLLRLFGKNVELIRKRERELRESEPALISDTTSKKIEEFLKPK